MLFLPTFDTRREQSKIVFTKFSDSLGHMVLGWRIVLTNDFGLDVHTKHLSCIELSTRWSQGLVYMFIIMTVKTELVKGILSGRSWEQKFTSYMAMNRQADRCILHLNRFVENGSLANIIKPNKFGPFPESLVAVYIAQVLEGLVYLHEQGVIHRDIKGANILTTKDGLVKLADFGVATKLTEADVNTHSVVGMPYWMAPEVIEISGVCPASDIWSVGCIVIELLTCVPPYNDLQPMPALFRIVQNPPIPDSFSPSLTDFLHQCFKKDARLRPDAKTLLSHPWIQNSRRVILQSSLRQSGTLKNIDDDGTLGVKSSNADGENKTELLLAEITLTGNSYEENNLTVGGKSRCI